MNPKGRYLDDLANGEKADAYVGSLPISSKRHGLQ